MADWVKQFSRIGTQELTLKERNLVAVAFKYYTGSRRAAWRVLSSIQKKENNKGASENVAWIKQYKAILEEELCNICQECLDLLTEYLIPNSQNGEGKVFFYKMKGDYYRYIAEYSTGDKKNQAA
jgi:14-3-3 protein epsilon